MQHPDPMQVLRNRQAPHDLSPEQFRALGRQVVDQIADFLASLPGRPVAPGESPAQVRALLGDRPLPEAGAPAADVLRDAAELNHELVNRLQTGGEVFISNAIIDGAYAVRVCIVNFRTTLADIEALPEIVIRVGRAVDAEMRPAR